MKNILSVEDAKLFFKKNKAIIIITTIVTALLYAALAIYNLYNATVIEELEEVPQELTQEQIVEILDQEPEEIIADELNSVQESLDANAVEFRFFIEEEEQRPFDDANLLKDFLVLDEVIQYVESEAGVPIPLDPELAVIVQKRESQPVLSLQIRTGDLEDNTRIANAYRTAFAEGVVPFVNSRELYVLDDEPEPYEENILIQILENMQIASPVSIAIGTVAALVFGFVLGLLIAAIKSMFSNKVNELTILQNETTDEIIPLYKLKDNSAALNDRVIQAVLYPESKKKFVLIQNSLDKDVSVRLEKAEIPVVHDVSEINTKVLYEEVVILTSIESTTKDWYQSQRIQLNNFKVPVKIIQL